MDDKSVNVSSFKEIDSFIISTRSEFRQNLTEIQKLFESSVNLFLSLIFKIGKLTPPNGWENSREEDVVRVFSKSFEFLLSIYYLYECGFYQTPLVFYRNLCELSVVGIAIGFDKSLYSKWKNNHRAFDKLSDVVNEVDKNPHILNETKKYSKFLLKEWERSSRDYLHLLKKRHVEDKVNNELLFLGIKKGDKEFQDSKIKSLVIFAMNLLLHLLDIFEIQKLSNEGKINGVLILSELTRIKDSVSQS